MSHNIIKLGFILFVLIVALLIILDQCAEPASGGRGRAHEAAEGEVAGVAASVAGVVGHGEGGRVGVAARVELGGGVAALEGRAAQRPLLALALAPPAEPLQLLPYLL